MLLKCSLLKIYLFMFLLDSSYQVPPRSFNLNLHSFTCINYTKTFSIFECGLMKATNHRYLITARLMLAKKMSNDLIFHIYVIVKSRSKKDSIRFLDTKFNACEAMRSSKGNHMLEMILREAAKSVNAPFKCPFKENFLFELRNFSVTDEFVPPIMPFVNFTFGFDYYDSETLIGSSTALGSITPKTKQQKH